MKHKIKFIFSLCVSLILAGCTSISFFIANAPTYFNDTKIMKDIVFNKEHNLTLDIYIPPSTVKINSQAIVFFYGGSWDSGDKAEYKFLGSTLANQGYIVFIPNYRKYPNVKFPDFMFDAADSVSWAAKNMPEYSKDLKSIVLMGHSAGANMAILLVTDKSYLRDDYKSISGGIGLSGAYNFTPNTESLVSIFGPPIKYPLMRPITFIDGHEPPVFLGHGGKDKVVAAFNYENMKDRLLDKGVCVVSKEYPTFGHAETIGRFSWVGGKEPSILKDIIHFLRHAETSKTCKIKK